MTRFQVLSAEFAHETNTFSNVPTGYDRFAAQDLFLDGNAAIAARGDSNTELAGFLDVARTHGWALQHVLTAVAEPAGRVTRDAYERLAAAIVDAARARRTELHGIALALHGAMVTEHLEDGEGELLARLRAVVGSQIPIAVTLDPHANVSAAMCRHANILVSYHTYPHVDMRRTGAQAAEILHRAIAGEIRPASFVERLPMLDEANGGRTDVGPMLPRAAQARAYERAHAHEVFAISLNGGFGRADIAEVGPSVVVCAQGDLAAHRAFARTLADDIWAHRDDVINQFLDVATAARLCKEHRSAEGRPIVVADYADNPGGGGYGDATALLAALLEADVQDACFGPMVDPQTVQALQGTAAGAAVQVRLGGKTDARVGGGPLELTAQLLRHSDGHYYADGPMTGGLHKSWGPTVVLRVRGIDILVVTEPAQMLDLAQFRAFGIEPTDHRVVALKSMQHFRAAFEPIASRVIVCDSGALCTPDLRRLPYHRVPRPVHPLDMHTDLAAWRAGSMDEAA